MTVDKGEMSSYLLYEKTSLKWSEEKKKKSSRDGRKSERLSDPETFFLFFVASSKILTMCGGWEKWGENLDCESIRRM